MVAVVVIKYNVVYDIQLFNDTETAEKAFLDTCATEVSNWDEYTQDDIQNSLDDGYVLTGVGSICICHPSN